MIRNEPPRLLQQLSPSVSHIECTPIKVRCVWQKLAKSPHGGILLLVPAIISRPLECSSKSTASHTSQGPDHMSKSLLHASRDSSPSAELLVVDSIALEDPVPRAPRVTRNGRVETNFATCSQVLGAVSNGCVYAALCHQIKVWKAKSLRGSNVTAPMSRKQRNGIASILEKQRRRPVLRRPNRTLCRSDLLLSIIELK